MKKWKPGVWGGIFFVIFSVVFFLQSLAFPYSGTGGPGPGFLPLWLSGILLILSLFYIYESINAESSEGEPMPKGRELKNILFILSCLVFYLLVLSFLGFVLSSTIFLFVLLYREYKWYFNIGFSMGASIFLFWLIGSVLNVTLPVNGFGW